MIQKVTQLLAEHQSDLLISTLPMCSQYISDYKQVTGDPIPLYTYITDLDAHNEWLAPGTNCYFVAAESTRQQLLRLGYSSDNSDMRQRMAVTLRSLDQISALDKFWERRQAAC